MHSDNASRAMCYLVRAGNTGNEKTLKQLTCRSCCIRSSTYRNGR